MSKADRLILEARDIRKTYRLGRVDVPVLRGADLRVMAGEWVAILGASGSGKSTLLHVIGDLDQPDAGSGGIHFESVPVHSLSNALKNEYRCNSVGFVFQFYHLMPELPVIENTMLPMMVQVSQRPRWVRTLLLLTALLGAIAGAITCGIALNRMAANIWPESTAETAAQTVASVRSAVLLASGITLGGLLGSLGCMGVFFALWTEIRTIAVRTSPAYAAARKRAIDLLTSFGLGHRLKHRPRELSGGERQRVAIARALMNKPRILLADEPTGNLDEKTGGEILDLIAQQHKQGLTIVMVTHDPAIAQRADRIVQLHDGRVVAG